MLIDNTLFLREKYPAIRNYFLEREDDIELNALEILQSKSGSETIRYQVGDKQLMVHSMYDPMREAERIITSHQDKINSNTHVFFYGIGMGYHIEKFKELYPNNTYSVYEPVPEIFLAMSEKRLLNRIITKETKHFYIDLPESESDDFLQDFSSGNRNTQIIFLPSYENIVRDKVEQFNQKVKKVVRNRHTNLRTDTKFQKLWVKNSLINFSEVLNTPNMLRDIDQSQFDGKPAMIVSAGPSLAEDIEYIRYIKENNLAYLFAVGSAINSLIEYDVLPDVVCTYDPKETNYKIFKKMYDNKMDNVPMLFGSSVGYETLTKYQGPKVHFVTTQDKTSTYFLGKQLDLKQDLISDSPSIAVMTFQVLNKLGADPIIFAGQNLGYLNNQLYSKGIEYEHRRTTVDKKQLENAIKTKDVYGNEIKTNLSFNNMRENIEQYAALYKDTTLINTTKGGAAIKGVTFKRIEDILETTLILPIQKDEWWNKSNSYDIGKLTDQQEDLNQSIIKFDDLISRFEDLLKSILKYTKLKNKSMLESLFRQLDKLYVQLNQNIYYSNFLSFYIRAHVEYLKNEMSRLKSLKDSLTKGTEIYYAFTSFINQCKQANAELKQIINNSIQSFID
ncbi:motility associated factor glycosyltransferase family protein [Virgibacillus sp. L01]|uniref:motility associated factor glycosyltransferase family protein n=1 Tax=Virgibacillus sp. L01 TaxID=3457429 RepID=UPI003FD5AAA4